MDEHPNSKKKTFKELFRKISYQLLIIIKTFMKSISEKEIHFHLNRIFNSSKKNSILRKSYYRSYEAKNINI